MEDSAATVQLPPAQPRRLRAPLPQADVDPSPHARNAALERVNTGRKQRREGSVPVVGEKERDPPHSQQRDEACGGSGKGLAGPPRGRERAPRWVSGFGGGRRRLLPFRWAQSEEGETQRRCGGQSYSGNKGVGEQQLVGSNGWCATSSSQCWRMGACLSAELRSCCREAGSSAEELGKRRHVPLRETAIRRENVSFSLYLHPASPFRLPGPFPSAAFLTPRSSFAILRKFLSLFCLPAFAGFIFLSPSF